jgi:putative Mg2+ transporter-C (MgtC) family protein
MPDLPWWDVLLRLAVAAGLGGAIGIERELREREAGFRTHLLVSVGAALFTLVSAYAWSDFRFGGGITFDPTRVAAQVVTGVGFLGAGAIIRQGLVVRGLTTAATLWVVAAIGMAAGAGFYWAAALATLVALFTLWPLRLIARRLFERPHRRRLTVELRRGRPSAPVIAALEGLGLRVASFRLAEDGERRALEAEVELPRGARPEEALLRLGQLDEVAGARWA